MVVNSHFTPQEGPSASVRRHQSQCSVCSHPQRQEIEDAWLNWANTTELADKYRLSRDALYRHMHALGCYSERQSRRKRLYENILERAQMTSFRGSDLVKVSRNTHCFASGKRRTRLLAYLIKRCSTRCQGRNLKFLPEKGLHWRNQRLCPCRRSNQFRRPRVMSKLNRR